MFIFAPAHFPAAPGVYLMKDGQGRIIYVGKAKSLRARLASYFVAPERLTPKTRIMTVKIASIDILRTTTEKEALLLEESLIKKHRPRYNIVLRDDKKYILYKLDAAADYPRLTTTRTLVRDGSLYFGPFTSAFAARETWRAIHRLFPLRRCKDAAFRNRQRPCLYFDMGRCLAPCVRPVPVEEYRRMVRQVELFLSGRAGELTAQLEEAMHQAADKLEFERAAGYRDLLGAVRQTLERQAAVLPGGADQDVLALVQTPAGLALGLIFVRQGRVIGRKAFTWPGLDLSEGPEVVVSFLPQFYGPGRLIPPRILLPWPVKDAALAEVLGERRGGKVHLAAPRDATDKKLLELARENALAEIAEAVTPDPACRLKAALHLGREPARIECVDISHLAGQEMRAGQVVFEAGEPKAEDYRVYALPRSEGTGDDYRALAEWLERRLESGPPWPDLVLIDGGRGQLAAVAEAMRRAGQEGLFELAAIAKAGRAKGELNDQIFRPGRKNPLPLPPGSPELLFLQRLRDAAHRFVLGRQRRVRNRQAIQSELLSLDGVGPRTARLLWERFGSLAAMAAAGEAELAALPGVGARRAARLAAALARLAPGSARGPAASAEAAEGPQAEG
jgi:excinuclease ABC subunit C